MGTAGTETRLTVDSSYGARKESHLSSNLTLPTLTDDWATICYYGLESPRVTLQSCSPLINHFISNPDFHLPKLWIPGPREPKWQMQGCKLRIVSGKWESRFSMRDVVVEMERVLAMCQPPAYRGIGGSAPVMGKEKFMYAAFHVQIMGVRQ